MTQTLDEKIRKLVIMGCHPECKTYEEALEKELIVGCNTSEGKILGVKECLGDVSYIIPFANLKVKGFIEGKHFLKQDFKIIGLPITLGRVLKAINCPGLSFRYFFGNPLFLQIEKEGKIMAKWQLTKDGIDCKLKDQSQETKEKLLELLS
jgi:hypothetical protein